MKKMVMFPGQGSQRVGMGKQLIDLFPAIMRPTFEEAEESVRIPLSKLCLDGPESELQLTAIQQPAMLSVSMGFWRVLKAETELEPSLFAGHSLGEYTALAASGRLDFARACYLVHQRGSAMQKAVPAGVGRMAAVMAFNADELVSMCKDLSSDGLIVEVVNFNSKQQQIISGHAEAVEAVTAALSTKRGVICQQLPVSAPFHSSLMKPARIEMTPLLTDTSLKDGQGQVVPNINGEIADSYHIDNLIQQIDQPVLWTKTMATAADAGCQTFIECGPGRVLTGLARRNLGKQADYKFINCDDITTAISALS